MVSEDIFSRIEPKPTRREVEEEAANVASGDVALCGQGSVVQRNAQLTANPTFELVTADADGPPELVKLAADINKHFGTLATPILEDKRAATTIGNLEITVLIAAEGFKLVYAWPKPGGKKAYPPQWILGGRFWLWLSRVVYKLTHRRARIPANAFGTPSPTRPKGGGAGKKRGK